MAELFHGSRRLEDFEKYGALCLAEELVSVGKTTGDTKAASYDIIATTLREKIHVPREQFKAYFWLFWLIRSLQS